MGSRITTDRHRHEVVTNEIDQGPVVCIDLVLNQEVVFLHGCCGGVEIVGKQLAIADDVGVQRDLLFIGCVCGGGCHCLGEI